MRFLRVGGESAVRRHRAGPRGRERRRPARPNIVLSTPTTSATATCRTAAIAERAAPEDAEHRSAGARRPALHRRALAGRDLHAVALRDAHRRIRLAEAGHRHPARRRGADHRAGPRRRWPRVLQQRRLHDRRRRQVAPRPRAAGGPDWNGEIKPGPLDIGFDYCFIMPATGDRVPASTSRTIASSASTRPIRSRCSYGEPIGDEPTGRGNPDLLKCSPATATTDDRQRHQPHRLHDRRQGGAWKDEDMADVFTAQGGRVHRAATARKPFFLFFAPHDLHVPRVPHPRFAGKTTMGPRGDAIAAVRLVRRRGAARRSTG